MTANAITIGEFQIVTKYYGHPVDVALEFDFCHNMSYFYKGRINILTDHQWFEGTTLKFNEERARDLSSTLTRIPKFVARGMKNSRKEIAKILKKICEDNTIDYERDYIEKLCEINSDEYV